MVYRHPYRSKDQARWVPWWDWAPPRIRVYFIAGVWVHLSSRVLDAIPVPVTHWNMVWVLGSWGLTFLAGIFLGGWRYNLIRKV